MTQPQSWPPLCGAVAGCGALLVLSGAVKLARTARGGDAGTGTAVQKALRLDDGRWRIFQACAGAVESAVGALVCAGVAPAIVDTLMACQGAVFVALLTYVIRKRIAGDCGCVARRRPKNPETHVVTRWHVARAAAIVLAGAAGALEGAREPSTLPRPEAALAWTVALATLALLTVVDLELRTPRCRRALLFPTRTTLGEVTAHNVFQAMVATLGAVGDEVLFRRAQCIDEFWFPTRAAENESAHQPRYLQIRAGREPSGALALRASVAEQAPVGDVRTLTVRRQE